MDYDANRICEYIGVKNGKKCLRKVSLKDKAHGYKLCGVHYCHHREKSLDKKLLEILKEEESEEEAREAREEESEEEEDLESIDKKITAEVKADLIKKIKLFLDTL